MADFKTKQGDTRNSIEAFLKENGTTVDLTDCTVTFKMKDEDDLLIDREITDTVDDEGKVIVNLTSTELDNVGKFKAEFQVEFPDGEIETFPNQEYLDIEIIENL